MLSKAYKSLSSPVAFLFVPKDFWLACSLVFDRDLSTEVPDPEDSESIFKVFLKFILTFLDSNPSED